MKRVLVILTAALLVFGVAGNAMAYFDNMSDLILVAYEGAPTSPAGNEVYYDLGLMDGSELPGSALDTGINLADFDATSWNSITVGLIGGDANTILFGSDANSNAVADISGFTIGQTYVDAFSTNAYGVPASAPKVTGTKGESGFIRFGSYVGGFDPSLAGFYAGSVTATDFPSGADSAKAEVVLGLGTYEMGLWSSSQYSDASLLGTFTLDTTSGNLVVGYTPVPVPGALVLLGSSLMALVGIRRKNS